MQKFLTKRSVLIISNILNFEQKNLRHQPPFLNLFPYLCPLIWNGSYDMYSEHWFAC